MQPQSTERFRFRPVTMDDAVVLNDLNHAPGVMKYLDHTPPTPETVETSTIPEQLRIARDYPGNGMWLAYLNDSGDCIGWFALGPDKQNSGDVEIGYRLFPKYWGRGFATEGARELLNYAFDELAANRCFATTMAVNEPSRNVMQKIGLDYVRTFHEEFENPLPGTENGEVEYALIRDEWLLRRS